ncbi:MAG: PepSY-like domain-containing protein [Bacteroidia bacterium]
MKTTILMVVLSICSSITYAQKIKTEEVPAIVKDGFKKSFPNAKVTSWEKENGKYEAAFDVNKVETSALLDVDGKLVETESAIQISELPKAAIDYLSKTYNGVKIKEAAKIIESNGKIKYEAEIKGKDILFDEKGNLI